MHQEGVQSTETEVRMTVKGSVNFESVAGSYSEYWVLCDRRPFPAAPGARMAGVGPVHVLRGHFGEVQSLSYLSEDYLYTGDTNGELRLWNLGSCRADYQARLHDTNAGLLHLHCTPSYGTLISQGRDGCVRLWAAGQMGALDRPQPMFEIRTESFNFCRCAVWAPGRQCMPEGVSGAPWQPHHLGRLRVACAAHDPADVAVWRPAECPAPVVRLRQSPSETKHGMCMSLSFLPTAASAAATITTVPPTTTSSPPADIPQDLPPAQQPISTSRTPTHAPAAAEHTDRVPGTTLPAATCRVDTTTNSSSNTNNNGSGSCNTDDVTDPWFIVTGYEDGVVALWDLRSTFRPLGSLRVHGEPVMCMDLRARVPPRSGVRGAGAGGGGGGDVGGALMLPALQDNDMAARTPESLTYDCVSGSAGDQIGCCVLRPAECQPIGLAVKQPPKLRAAGTGDVHIRPDGKLFACGCWDGRVRLYSLRRREPLAVLKYHGGQVTAVAFSPLTQTLASASRDTTVALWDVYTNRNTADQQ